MPRGLPAFVLLVVGACIPSFDDVALGSSRDAGQPAAPDATKEEDGGGVESRFCAGQTTATLCLDFDDGSVPAKWSPSTSGGATIAVDGSVFTSRPFGLTATYEVSGAFQGASIATPLDWNVEMTVRAKVRIDRVGSAPMRLFTVQVTDAYQARVQVSPQGELVLDEKAPENPNVRQFGLSVAQGGWHDLVATFRRSATESSVKARLDGADAPAQALLAHGYSDRARVILGCASFVPLTEPWTAHFDDVVVEGR